MLSPLLAYRPASVRGRLPARCDACPLSVRDLLSAAEGRKLPAVEAVTPGVVRAALVAAKVFHSTIGLVLPRAIEPEAWFKAVVRTADEIAAGLPIFLAGEVRLADNGAMALEQATARVWKFVDTGLTHVTLEAADGPPDECGRVLAEVAAPLLERGLGFACAIPLFGAPGAGRRALALVDDLRRRGATPDAVSVTCPAPDAAEAARAQLGALDRLAAALRVPMLRRGPVSPALLAALAGSDLRGCEDGGAAARASEADAGDGDPDAAARRERWREQAEALLGPEESERLEARAFFEVAEFLEALGASQSALVVAAALERRQAEDRA